MRKKHILILAVLVAIVVVCYIGMKKVKRSKLVAQVREVYGDIPDLESKSAEELQEMLNSREQ